MARLATEKLIETAFLKIYRTKYHNAITVKEICQAAGISRATFYVYFSGVENLLEFLESRTLAEIRQVVGTWRLIDLKKFPLDQPFPMFLDVYDYIRQHHPLFAAAFGPYGNQEFVIRYADLVKQNILEKIKMDKIPTKHADLLATFCMGSVKASSEKWISNPDIATVEEMAVYASKVVRAIITNRY